MKADKNTEIFRITSVYKHYEPQISTCKETLDWQTESIKVLTEGFLKATEHVAKSQYNHMSDIHWSDIRRVVSLTFKPI